MKKFRSASLFATAGVLALTTAVYMPGFRAFAENTDPACIAAASSDALADGASISSATPTDDGKGVILSGECTYNLGSLTNKYLQIADGAKITLNFSDATVVNIPENLPPIKVTSGGELTITGTAGNIIRNGATHGVIIRNEGKLTLDGANLSNGAGIISTDGASATTTVKDSTVTTLRVPNGKVKIINSIIGDASEDTYNAVFTNGGTVTVDSGKFESFFAGTHVSNITLKGGQYNKDKFDAALLESLVAEGLDLTAYEHDGYYYLEATHSNDDIVLDDIATTEDVETSFAEATLEGSIATFDYALTDAEGYAISENVAKLDVANKTITAYVPGTYQLVATSTTFANATFTKSATVTVTSALESVSLTKNAAESELANADAVADSFANNDTVDLYVGDKLTLDYTRAAEMADVTFASTEVADTSILSLDTATDKVSITADAAGTSKLVLTATPVGDSDTSKIQTLTLKVNVHNRVESTDFAGNTFTVNIGDSLELSDLITFTADESRELKEDSFTYTIVPNTAYFTVDGEKITITAARTVTTATGNIPVYVEVTDGSGTTVRVKATVYAMSDFTITDGTDALDTDTDGIAMLNMLEEEDATIATGDITPDTAIGYATPTYSYHLAQKVVSGGVTSYVPADSSDHITLTDNGDGTAAVTSSTATDENTPAYIMVTANGSDKLVKYVAVTVRAPFTEVSVADSEGNEVANSTATETNAPLKLDKGEVANYSISHLADNARVSAINVESSNDTVQVTQDGKNFTVTGDTAGESATITVTVTGEDVNGNPQDITASFDVAIYNKIKDSDFEGKSVTVNVGDTVAISDLFELSESGVEREVVLDSLTSEVATNDTFYTVNDDGTITITAANTEDGKKGKITAKVILTDESGTTATVSGKVYAMSDFALSGATATEDEYTLKLTEEGGSASTTISVSEVIPVGFEGTPTYQFQLVQPNGDGTYTAVDSSDYITITDVSNGVATVTGLTATDEDAPAYFKVTANGSENLVKYVAVTVIGELNNISVKNSDGQEIANSATEVATAIEQKWGEIAEYSISYLSPNAKIASVGIASDSDMVNVSLNDDDTFTVTSDKVGTTAQISVTVESENVNGETVELVASFPVTIVDDPANPAPAQTIADGIYIIRSTLNTQKVIDITTASANNGANVQLFVDNGTIAQKFAIRYNGEGHYTIENLKSIGKVLTATDYHNVAQHTYDGTDGQLWQLIPAEDGTFSFKSKATGYYLDVEFGNTADSTNIDVYPGNATAAQHFILQQTNVMSETAPLADGTYAINSALGDGLSLDITWRSTDDAANLQLYHTNGTPAQDFTLKYNPESGFYTIYTGTGDGTKVLDAEGAGLVDGTNVYQWHENGTIAQQWLIVENADGTYSIVSRCNGLYLDVSGAGTADGTNVQLYHGNDTKAQKFTFAPVSSEEE